MTRRLLNLLTLLSLLLCVAVAVLWVRSYWRLDYVGRYHVDVERLKWSRVHWMSDVGTVTLGHSWMTFASADLLEDYAQNYHPAVGSATRSTWYAGVGTPNRADSQSFWQRLGFSRRWSVDRAPIGYGTASFFGYVEVPHWLIALMAALLPATRLWRGQRASRWKRAGLCPACGYDLRATPIGCPECGWKCPGGF